MYISTGITVLHVYSYIFVNLFIDAQCVIILVDTE